MTVAIVVNAGIQRLVPSVALPLAAILCAKAGNGSHDRWHRLPEPTRTGTQDILRTLAGEGIAACVRGRANPGKATGGSLVARGRSANPGYVVTP